MKKLAASVETKSPHLEWALTLIKMNTARKDSENSQLSEDKDLERTVSNIQSPRPNVNVESSNTSKTMFNNQLTKKMKRSDHFMEKVKQAILRKLSN